MSDTLTLSEITMWFTAVCWRLYNRRAPDGYYGMSYADSLEIVRKYFLERQT